MGKKTFVALKTSDLKNGEMKTISHEGMEFLLCKIKNEFFALSAHCTHYGALLSDGVLSDDRIVCPLHHACFNAKTGNLLEPPAQDSLVKYDVKVDGENVVVTIPESSEGSRMPKMSKPDIKSDERKFVILGGGAAGNAAAQALREADFKGRIIMITQENRTPYDRPNLSKEYLSGEAEEAWMPLRSKEFYDEYGIEILFNKKVREASAADKKIYFYEGDSLKYDKLLIATGGKARKLNLPGEDLQNVLSLRSFDDADKIIEASRSAKKVIIIGASFIGLETAYSLTKKNIPVTIISQEEIPFERVFGREIGKLFKKHHEKAGVKFRLSHSLKAFEGKEKVEAVVLQNGDRIKTDLVIVGVGVLPSTNFVKGIMLLPDGSIKVNKYFQAAVDVYAAGDAATIQDWRTGEDIRIEHWRTAAQQGRIAAFNMAGRQIESGIVPFFWTSQVGLDLRYAGHAKDWQEIIIHGDVQSKDFIAFYLKNDFVYSAAGCNRDKDIAAIEELIRLNKLPDSTKLKYDSIDFSELLKS